MSAWKLLAIFFTIQFSSEDCQAVADIPNLETAIQNLNNDPKKSEKVLGSGGFGSVFEFQFEQRTIAAKLMPSFTKIPGIEERLQNLKEYQKFVRPLLQKVINHFRRDPDAESLAMSATEKQELETLDEPAREEILLLWNGIIKFVARRADLTRREIVTTEEIGQWAETNPAFGFKYLFCARQDHLTYWMFQERYGAAWSSPAFFEHFNARPLGELFEVYLKLMRKMRMLHDGGWVHCDIKPANILFRTADFTGDVVMVDYSITVKLPGFCAGGSKAYQAPKFESYLAKTKFPRTMSRRPPISTAWPSSSRTPRPSGSVTKSISRRNTKSCSMRAG